MTTSVCVCVWNVCFVRRKLMNKKDKSTLSCDFFQWRTDGLIDHFASGKNVGIYEQGVKFRLKSILYIFKLYM